MHTVLKTARSCENYPVEGYYIKVVNDITDESLVKQIAPYSSSINASHIEVALYTSSDSIQSNMRYTCSILAYNAVGNSSTSSIEVCKEFWHHTHANYHSGPFAMRIIDTTDVQSSTITGSDHQLNVTCFFAESTLAEGCAVCLEKSGEEVYQMIPRVNGTAKGVIRTEFSVDCYNFSVVDWEKDGSIGSLGVLINISFNLPLPVSNCNNAIPTGKFIVNHRVCASTTCLHEIFITLLRFF